MSTLNIPISKGKDLFIPIDTDLLNAEDFPADVYREIIFQGLKQVLNRGMTGKADGEGYQSSKGLEGKALVENNQELLEKAKENFAACQRGEIRITGGKAKAKGASNKALTTEAMRLARLYLKDALKRAGKKVSLISGKEITAGAKSLLETEDAGPEIWAEAEANLAERARKEQAVSSKLSEMVGLIDEDPALVRAAEAKKKPKVKAPVSQISAVRQRPEQRPAH